MEWSETERKRGECRGGRLAVGAARFEELVGPAGS